MSPSTPLLLKSEVTFGPPKFIDFRDFIIFENFRISSSRHHNINLSYKTSSISDSEIRVIHSKFLSYKTSDCHIKPPIVIKKLIRADVPSSVNNEWSTQIRFIIIIIKPLSYKTSDCHIKPNLRWFSSVCEQRVIHSNNNFHMKSVSYKTYDCHIKPPNVI